MLRGLISAVRARGLPLRSEFSLQAVLASDVQIRSWGVQGLPADNVSSDSGIIAMASQSLGPPLPGAGVVGPFGGDDDVLQLPRLPRGVISGAAFRATEDRLRAAGAIEPGSDHSTAAEMLQSEEAREVVATLPAS